jgi:hypothetical protein
MSNSEQQRARNSTRTQARIFELTRERDRAVALQLAAEESTPGTCHLCGQRFAGVPGLRLHLLHWHDAVEDACDPGDKRKLLAARRAKVLANDTQTRRLNAEDAAEVAS